MSGSTNFLQINPNATNQESDAAYASDTQRSGGMVSGVFASILANKIFYQMSIFVTAMCHMLTGKNYSPNDGSASPGTALSALTTILSNILTNYDRPLFNGPAAVGGANPSMQVILPSGWVPAAMFFGILRISAGAYVVTSGSAGVNVQVLIGSSVIAQYNVKSSGDFVKFAIDVPLTFGFNTLNCYANVVGSSSSGAPASEPQMVVGAYAGDIGTGATITFQLATPLSGGNINLDYLIAELV
jgi:hypothetical protein